MFFLVLAVLVFQEGATTEVKDAYVAALIETQSRDLDELAKQIAGMEKQIAEKKKFRLNENAPTEGRNILRSGSEFSGWEFPERRFAVQSVQEDVAELEKYKKEERDCYESVGAVLLAKELRKGQVGFLGNGRTPYPVSVFQVLENDRVLVKVLGEMILVANIDTSELSDGKQIAGPLIVEVKGSETYGTAIGGTNTVMSVRALSAQEMRDVLAYAKGRGSKRPLDLRKWRDNGGKLLAEAEFVRKDGKVVHLVDGQGNSIEIEWVKLSRADRVFIDGKK